MKLDGLPIGAIDWRGVEAGGPPGETGSPAARARNLGGVQLRIVQYGAGYRADHWCAKGHIVHVLAGDLVIEHDDCPPAPWCARAHCVPVLPGALVTEPAAARRSPPPAGMTGPAPDDRGPPHRV